MSYPIALVTEVRRMRAAGWTPTEIHRVFRNEGRDPLPNLKTVMRWANPKIEQSDRERHIRDTRARVAANATFRLRGDTPEYQAAFITRLRAEGEPWQGVVRVCRVVFSGHWTVARAKSLVGEPTIHQTRLMKEAAA